MRRLWFVLALVLVVSSSCAPPGDAGFRDGSVATGGCDGSTCASAGCAVDLDCATDAGPMRCDAQSGRCVSCLSDADCPAGQLCNPRSAECAQGCTADHSCGDAGTCEADAGLCVECLADADCGDPSRPRCAPETHACVPCLPDGDNCGPGTFCAPAGDTFACTSGCKDDGDCGAAPDGGSGDGLNHCDASTHECVGCVQDDNCSLGSVCQNSACVDGCTAQHDCPSGLTCCGQQCVDAASDGTNCGVCGHACATGSSCCGGACASTDDDPDNCGTCGNACSVENGTPACNGGHCAIAVCDSDSADCDGLASNGCETYVASDPFDCGTCGNVCRFENAMSACSGGHCSFAACNPGWADCNGTTADGCETHVDGDPNNCGVCGHVCNLANGTSSCSSGACAIAACNPGWADCNGLAADGCETHVDSDPNNCAACGHVCNLAEGTSTCSSGACAIAACNSGWADCNGTAVDGCETHVDADPDNCAACGHVCNLANATSTCSSGACAIAACNSGWADCNGLAADGCETHVDSDPNNCAACGHVCNVAEGTSTCSSGACAIASCNSGWADCNGLAVDGCETHVDADPNNCAACGHVCNVAEGTPTCSSGACAIAACTTGWADCNATAADGCETHVDGDPNNCGACGHVCNVAEGTSTCSSGACAIAACTTGWADCNRVVVDGCETHVDGDPNNCGGCGHVCNVANGTPTCSSGACAIASCNSGWADCNGTAADGCETRVDADPSNCGTCGFQCASGHDCASSACQ